MDSSPPSSSSSSSPPSSLLPTASSLPTPQVKTFTTSRQMTYRYLIYPGTSPSKVPLLLLHGFPDSSLVWSLILPHLHSTGHTLIIPDLLGYGGTSKPTTASSYNSRAMADDLAELLDHEHVPAVVSMGHDWGSFMASRLCLWYPERVKALVLLNVAYSPPSEERFDLEGLNKWFKKVMGSPTYAYWEFFVSDGAEKIMQDNLESVYAALHGANTDTTPNWLHSLLCVRNAMHTFLSSHSTAPLAPYAANNPTYHADFISRYTRDGFSGPLNWYSAIVDNHHWEVEREIPKERFRINKPALFVGCTRDPECPTAAIERVRAMGLLPDLKIAELESGHWSPLEVPRELCETVGRWLRERESELV